jgi:hypothetical protein
MPDLMDILGYVGQSFDKPGRAVRGLLGGRPEEGLAAIPFSDTLGLTNPGNAVSGRALLEAAGLLNKKGPEDGFDFGDVAGMGTEMALDPINLLGGPLLAKLGLAGKAARKSNAFREALLESGARALPEDLAKTTKIVNEAGQPLKTFHGTAHAFDAYDLAKTDPMANLGAAIYTTADPEYANEFARSARNVRSAEVPAANVRMQYVHATNPLVDTAKYDPMELAASIPELRDLVGQRSLSGADVIKALKARLSGGSLFGGNARLPETLQAAGFDAVTQGKHHIAFNPSQVYDPWILPNARRVPSLTPLAAAIAGGNAARGVANVPSFE